MTNRVDTDQQETLALRTASIEDEDVKQEAELLRLLGKTVNIRVIRSQMLNDNGRILYYGAYAYNVEPHVMCIPWAETSCDVTVVQRIIDWALEQDDTTQGIVFAFLDSEDKAEALPQVLAQLGIMCNECAETSQGNTNKTSMADIMRRTLPATKEELITLIQSVSPETKRPAATVRQFLRTETRKGKIMLAEDGNYHLA